MENKPSKSDAVYDLYAVINYASRSKQHYYSIVKSNSVEGIWVECDDNNLRIKEEEDVINKGAYILFYRKVKISATNKIHLIIS